jgi:hypothetical protein
MHAVVPHAILQKGEIDTAPPDACHGEAKPQIPILDGCELLVKATHLFEATAANQGGVWVYQITHEEARKNVALCPRPTMLREPPALSVDVVPPSVHNTESRVGFEERQLAGELFG